MAYYVGQAYQQSNLVPRVLSLPPSFSREEEKGDWG